MKLPQIGEVFEGRYQVTDVLGEGGFAIVYRALDPVTSRDVVLKVLAPRGGAYREGVEARFKREARIFATLQNPHTITMFDFGESSEGLLFMVFEFVHGRELGAILLEKGPFASDTVIHVLRQLLSALAEAHGANILHRDIKPGNILLFSWSGDPNRAKLIDFGIAKDMRDNATKITQAGKIIGTLRYMAPEQVFDEALSPRADIFSLGLVACEMLTGEPVVGGESKREMLELQTSLEPLVVPSHVGTPALRAVIGRMMAREPNDRYASAADAIAALRNAKRNPSVDHTPTPEHPEGFDTTPSSGSESASEISRNVPKPSRRYDWRLIVGLTGLAGLAVSGFVLTLGSKDEPRPRTDALKVLTTVADESSMKVERADADPAEPMDAGGEFFDADASRGLERDASRGLVTLPDLTVFDDDSGAPVTAFVPSTAADGGPMPIVLMFHRQMRSGRHIIESSEFARQAEEHRFVIVAPDAPDAMNWPGDRLDIAYRALRLAHVNTNIDLRRVFLVGDEYAARFANDVSCAVPVSGIASAFDGHSEVCEPRTSTPRIRLYGLLDPQTRPEGGYGCNIITGNRPPAKVILGKWRKTYQCGEVPEPWGDFEGGTCDAYSCKTAPFVVCAMESGHMWPGASDDVFDMGMCPVVTPEIPFPMAAAVWQFFGDQGHTLSDAEVVRLQKAIEL